MAQNMFELIGRISWIDFKTFENGTAITKLCIGQKTSKKDNEGKPIYNNFFVTFIDSPVSKETLACNLFDRYKKDDYIHVKGLLNIDKYIPKNTTDNKMVENISLIGRTFCGVHWDEFEKRYVDDV